jgi:hypothetical protein
VDSSPSCKREVVYPIAQLLKERTCKKKFVEHISPFYGLEFQKPVIEMK